MLLQTEEGALGYLRRRAGVVAAEHALRAYRRQHKSSMLARTSEARGTISRGAYRGLESQVDKDNEVLIAIAKDGRPKRHSELSRGPRFQLYLALRVACHHEAARLRAPVPFLADDIMETLDDFRAGEAMRLPTGMGEVGQVIYLTLRNGCLDRRPIWPSWEASKRAGSPRRSHAPRAALAVISSIRATAYSVARPSCPYFPMLPRLPGCPCRHVLLSAGDRGFDVGRTFDLEV